MYNRLRKLDKPLLIATIILTILGLVMIYSSSSVSTILRYDVSSSHFFIRQLIFVIVTFFIGFLFIIHYPTKKYGKYAIPLALLCLFSLTLLFVLGETNNSSRSWFNLGLFSLQPSEFAKTIIIIFSAVYYNMLSKQNIKNIYPYLIPLALGILIATLVIMQPDFGSAVIILGITGMIFISVPVVNNNALKIIKILAVGAVILAAALLYFGTSILNSAQMQRFIFQDPCTRYTEETGYQVCNGMIAIKNGGLFGQGLGNSTQKYLYLPESHTDFIFPIIVEELGLIVGVGVILLYAFILFRMLKIAKGASNLRCSILAYGAFALFTLHILINILGILAVIPLTGVPLPILSYGGSSTVNFLIILFITQRVAIENKEAKTKRDMKKLHG